MKNIYKVILMCLLSIQYSFIKAQNLVPNPSFEDTLGCPFSSAQINKTSGWFASRATPDYYNSCAEVIAGVPNNPYGFQFSHIGEAYVGLFTFQIGNPNEREIIGCQLTNSLNIGQSYYFSFWVNLAQLSPSSATCCSSNNLGVRFSTIPYYESSNPVTIDNFYHFVNPTIIDDTLNWTMISGSFIADSNYQYMMIGNFLDDANTDTMVIQTIGSEAYYFIDDVCVTTDSLYSINWTGVEENNHNYKNNNIKIFPNPSSSFINISNYDNNFDEYEIEIIDLLGNKIIGLENLSLPNLIDISYLSNGMYYITFFKKNNLFVAKFIKN